jgi:hypothetical protein
MRSRIRIRLLRLGVAPTVRFEYSVSTKAIECDDKDLFQPPWHLLGKNLRMSRLGSGVISDCCDDTGGAEYLADYYYLPQLRRLGDNSIKLHHFLDTEYKPLTTARR